MEESEKRRERLKAMRMEASQAGMHGEAENSMGPNCGNGLANPLIESQTTQSTDSRPRFDYYTDPMAAYSADKRRNNHSPQVSQPPRPAYSNAPGYRAQGSYFLDQRPSQAHHHTFGSPVHHTFSGPSPENPPNVWGSPRGTPTSNFTPNSSRFSSPTSYGYGQGGPGYGYVRGRGQMFSNSARPDSGRGNGGRWQGGRRGLGRGEARPHLYYDKSMTEDPWERLRPTIWKKQYTPSEGKGTPGSWLPNSINMKKARVSEEQLKLTPKQSLAEYLAASFSEVAADEGGNAESSSLL